MTESKVSANELFEMWQSLRKRMAFVVGVVGMATLLAAVYAYRAPKVYTAKAVLLPSESGQEGMGSSSRLQGLASLVGLPSSQGGSGIYYEEVFRSLTFLHRIADARYPSARGDSAGLYELLGYAGTDSARKFEDLREHMSEALDIHVEKTGVVTLYYSSIDPVMAAAVLNGMLDSFNRFYMEKKMRKSQSNLEFISQRLADVDANLNRSERELRSFVEANRNFQGSPALMFEWQKRQRTVKINEELFIAVKKEHELAKIQEEKDRSVINVLDYAEAPLKKSGPKRIRIIGLAFLASLIFGVAAAVLVDRLTSRKP